MGTYNQRDSCVLGQPLTKDRQGNGPDKAVKVLHEESRSNNSVSTQVSSAQSCG